MFLGANRNTYLDDYVHFADFKAKMAQMRRLDGNAPGSETNGQIGDGGNVNGRVISLISLVPPNLVA